MRKDALMEMAMDGFSGQMLALLEERDAAIADLQSTYEALKTSVELILARMAADDLRDAQDTDNGQVIQDFLALLAPRDEAIAALSKSVDLSKSVELIV
ncbi:MAG: hypothetical protein ACRESZ_14415, partial [Methylococcales bacterium]